jgi:hypothetical protein
MSERRHRAGDRKRHHAAAQRGPGVRSVSRQGESWINADAASAEERYTAACLYLALMTEACLGLIGAGGPIIVEGPFSLNETYLGILSLP